MVKDIMSNFRTLESKLRYVTLDFKVVSILEWSSQQRLPSKRIIWSTFLKFLIKEENQYVEGNLRAEKRRQVTNRSE